VVLLRPRRCGSDRSWRGGNPGGKPPSLWRRVDYDYTALYPSVGSYRGWFMESDFGVKQLRSGLKQTRPSPYCRCDLPFTTAKTTNCPDCPAPGRNRRGRWIVFPTRFSRRAIGEKNTKIPTLISSLACSSCGALSARKPPGSTLLSPASHSSSVKIP